jgi:uncharacterized protein YeaO (DUF488 family)
MVGLDRSYDEPGRQDGSRTLVERLWPRDLEESHAKTAVALSGSTSSVPVLSGE